MGFTWVRSSRGSSGLRAWGVLVSLGCSQATALMQESEPCGFATLGLCDLGLRLLGLLVADLYQVRIQDAIPTEPVYLRYLQALFGDIAFEVAKSVKDRVLGGWANLFTIHEP